MDGASFEELKVALDPRYTDMDLLFIEHAYTFAKAAHEGQTRSTGEPYFNHVFQAAMKLAKLRLPSEVIAAGLLHDVPEDTEHTLEEIQKEFGDDVAHMVESCTKLGKVKYRGEERYIENLRKMFVAMAEDVRVIFIKFADRMHNMETLYARPEEKRLRIAREVMEIYAPIANRLGMGEYKGQFEDHAFKYLKPREYTWTQHLLEERVRKFGPAMNRAIPTVEKALHDHNVKFVDIHGRIKYCYSLYKKLIKYNNDIDKVYDVMALRIITHSVADCYAALGILHSLYTPLPGRIKDYIAQPKPNGYTSLHTTVFDDDGAILEFQIRTQQMHEEDEYGIAAHWRYKEGEERSRQVTWMEEFAKIQRELTSNDFMRHLDDMKLDMFRDRIFVFTPKGDVIDLPEDSTPVDFAYAVHTDIGNKTTMAKVNRQVVPLDTPLQSGDMCEIETDKNRKMPNEDWLKFVKTHHARQKIRDAINKTKKPSFLSSVTAYVKRKK